MAAVNGADVLVRRLRAHGVRHVFGYPGGQITPLYDALQREPAIRHVLARDEQAAGFMADGYARATNRPGVCLAVCGPGVLNAATPLATAFTDSVPVFLIGGQVPMKGLGLRSGFYHENDQLHSCTTLTKWCARVENPEQIVTKIDHAFQSMMEGRRGPAFLEVPVDIQRAEAQTIPGSALALGAGLPTPPRPRTPSIPEVEKLAELIRNWTRPLILVGGGVTAAGAEPFLIQVADRLGAPVFHTAMGKCGFPNSHPLSAGLPWQEGTSDLTNMVSFMSPLFAQADGLLAIGCRFSQLATGSWSLPVPSSLAQIDIDGTEIGRHYPVKVGIQADAAETLRALLEFLNLPKRSPWASANTNRKPWRLPGPELLSPLRRTLPRDAIIAADITRLSYILLSEFPLDEPRTFLHPAGYVSMGFGLPAAIGAKAAYPDRTVIAVAGDGCFLMSGMELATAVQEKLPIIVILVNDGSLSLIKAIQERRYDSRFLGVDLVNPDFQLFAKAFGVRSWQVESDNNFEKAMKEAVASGETALVEVRIRG